MLKMAILSGEALTRFMQSKYDIKIGYDDRPQSLHKCKPSGFS